MSDDTNDTATQGGAVAWMTRNSVASNLLMLIIILGGILNIPSIKQEVFPEFTLDLVNISVPYPGAAPAEVEQGIVLAIEEAVRGVDGVKKVTSASAEGAGTVSVELLLGADPDKVLQDVKNEVDRIATFPEDAEDPQVALASRKQKVVSLILAGDQELSTLHALAEKARAELLSRGGVTQVELEGVPELEISVEVDRAALQSYGLTLDDVSRQLTLASLELPGGGVDTASGEILVRVDDRRLSGQEFADIVLLGTADGAQVRLGDVATITDGFVDDDRETYFNGRPAVLVTAYRVGSETPTSVAEAVKSYAEDLRAELPEAVDLTIWDDDSELLRGRIDLLVRNAQTGLLLVALVLTLFLDLRLALWVGLGIPISFAGAFFVMPWLGVSINMISLFALIITLGLVVDDAIVVGENVFEKTERGMPPLQASITGAREMVVPVTFAILTTFAAFAPMLTVPGVTGKIFGIIPLIVLAVLAFSLIESFFVLPAHLAHSSGLISSMLGVLRGVVDPVRIFMTGQLRRFIAGPYTATLEWAIRLRYATLAAAIALFFLAVGTITSGVLPFSFLPKIEADIVRVSARLPYGVPVERTDTIARQLQDALEATIAEFDAEDDIRGTLTLVGQGAGNFGPGAGARAVGSHLLSMEVDLVPVAERDYDTKTFSAAWQEALPPLAGVEALSFSSDIGASGGAAVDVQLSSTSTETLAAASQELTDVVRGYSDLKNVENTYAGGKVQLDFTLLPAARTLGLTSSDVARQLRSSFFGAEAIREQRGRNEIKVMVRLPEDQRRSEYDLEQLEIRTPGGGFVPLNAIADVSRGRSATTISRESGRRVVNVKAELGPEARSSREVLEDLEARVLPELLARYDGLEARFAGEQESQNESLGVLGKNYIFALFAIYGLLAVPFRSYVQPAIIMSAIPFGVVGAVGGHLLMGFELSVISIMGIIALSGVVVNDSLVLVDAANRYRLDDGLGPGEAIRAAGKRRFRPILLTSLTTFFGLLPMIFETSVQARFLIPMAISLGYGVLFVTVIVLLIVPALYMIIEDITGLATYLPWVHDDEAPAATTPGPEPA